MMDGFLDEMITSLKIIEPDVIKLINKYYILRSKAVPVERIRKLIEELNDIHEYLLIDSWVEGIIEDDFKGPSEQHIDYISEPEKWHHYLLDKKFRFHEIDGKIGVLNSLLKEVD